MRVALDLNNHRVHIGQVYANEEYFCPVCGERVIFKKGEIREHHFAHKADSHCVDSWHYEMGEWHSEWQDKFPAEMQEIVKKHDGKMHRADVLIETTKTVVEFQHSPLSADEFDNRNRFYNGLGYKVVWVFDATTQYGEDSIREHKTKENIYIWDKPRNTFNHMNSVSKNIDIYLEFASSEDDDLGHIKTEDGAAKESGTDDCLIVKVSWIPRSGFQRFAVNEKCLSKKKFVSKMLGVAATKAFTLKDAYDKPKYLYSENHSDYYDGCPISKTKKCVSSIIDISESSYANVMPCVICKYCRCDEDQYLCYKKLFDLKLAEGTEVVNVERYDEYSLKSLSVKIDDEIKKFEFEPLAFSGSGKSIFALWNECNPSVAIFRNIRTGYYVKITRDPLAQQARFHKVYGVFSKDQYNLKGESKELFGVDKNEWVLVRKCDNRLN